MLKTDIINKSIKKFKNNIDYSLIPEKFLKKDKIPFICKKHGPFMKNMKSHLKGLGCDECRNRTRTSKGEKEIQKFLDNLKIEYRKEYSFKKTKIFRYRFDFYIQSLNLCIEYDGLQHFKPVKKYNGIEGFKKTQKRDKVKNNFCKEYNIKLLRIKYNDKIEEVLKKYFNLC